MSQNTAKSMAYIMNESGGDFQEGGFCTSQPVAFNGDLSTLRRLTSFRKKQNAPTLGSGIVVKSEFIDVYSY